MKRPKLVAGWRKSWKWFSVQAAALQVSAAAVWMALPEDARANFPPAYVAGFFGAVALVALVGRLVDQGGSDA